MALLRESTPPIGLDVGTESVKLLQLQTGPSGLRVEASLRIPLPDDVRGDPDRRVQFAGETVQLALDGGTFRGRRVIAALPKELVHYKTHRLPPMAAGDVLVAAKIDARDLFRFDPDSADVQCIDAGPIRKGQDDRREVVLIAAGKQYIDQFVIALDSAGASVASLEIDPTAVWRAATRVAPAGSDTGSARPRVLLDVGAAQSRLLIGQGDTLRLVRTIDLGADGFRTAVSRKLGLSLQEARHLRRRAAAEDSSGGKLDGIRQGLAEATRHSCDLMAREVLAGVRYYAATFGGPAPRAVEIVGGEAGDAQLRSTLCSALLLPAKPADLFAGVDTAAIPVEDRTASLGEWAVALGLALKRMPDVARQASSESKPGHWVTIGTPAVPPSSSSSPPHAAALAGEVK